MKLWQILLAPIGYVFLATDFFMTWGVRQAIIWKMGLGCLRGRPRQVEEPRDPPYVSPGAGKRPC